MRYLLIIVLFWLSLSAKSQSTIRFCASVNADGGCMLQNNKFFSSPDSLLQKVSLLASNPNGFAKQAFMPLTFRPGILNGVPVKSRIRIEVVFDNTPLPEAPTKPEGSDLRP